MRKTAIWGALALGAMALAGCQTTGLQLGGGNTMATGGAAGSHAAGANSQLERCDAPLGTVSLVENQDAGWYTILRGEYQLPPTSNLLRLLIQQSNCFVVVERSAAGMNAMQRERALMRSGQMRGGSNFGGGQMVASDYALQPEVVFSSDNTGGWMGAVGGLIGGGGGQALAAIGANTKRREAAAMLTLVDNRSGVQVSASQGSAGKTDFGGFGSLFGGGAGAGLGGYSNTPQGQLLTAAFMDAYNQMVRSLRNYQAQTVKGQGLGGGGRLGVDGGVAPSQTRVKGPRVSVRSAQQMLNDMGYDAGSPDGKMGQRTVNALRAFQRDNGLAVTGRLDKATMQALSEQ